MGSWDRAKDDRTLQTANTAQPQKSFRPLESSNLRKLTVPVDALVAWEEVDAVADRVHQHHAAGADHVAIQAIATEPGRALDDLRALAPALLR